MSDHEIPRRADLEQCTPAELAIYQAQVAVEEAGASESLTNATILLSKARSFVADHVDGVESDLVASGTYFISAEMILERLREGGMIVSSNDLTQGQINSARARKAFYVDDDGFGSAYLSPSPKVDRESLHPSVRHILQFFTYDHLPAHLQAVSKVFADAAEKIATLPANAETTVALRKLLEAKDCAVRSLVCSPTPTS